MKTPEFHLRELRIIIGAIALVRREWLLAIEERVLELMSDDSKLLRGEAMNLALCNSKVRECSDKLTNLYGTLGSEAEAYDQALLLVEEPFLRKVA